jgi:integrase
MFAVTIKWLTALTCSILRFASNARNVAEKNSRRFKGKATGGMPNVVFLRQGNAVVISKSLEEIKGRLQVKEPKTKLSRRRVVVSSVTMEAFVEHRKAMLTEGHYASDKPVFCDTAGGWLRKSNVLRRSFRPIIERANAEAVREAKAFGGEPALLPPIRPYDLRHTGATLLLLAGVSPKVVSERLGHSTVVLTLGTYSHVLPGMQEQAASKLDAIFRSATQVK